MICDPKAEGILSGARQECQIRHVEGNRLDGDPRVSVTLVSHELAERFLRSINSRQVAHISQCLVCGPPPYLLVPMPTGTDHSEEQAEEQAEESEQTHDEEIEDVEDELEDVRRTTSDEPESEHGG